ncbi:MAG: carbohydrate binding domain-containing protein [Gammaproteobacteria bacterium]|nr:carbohydrate binding domain-containing protein [Gammaproteobacteria bacterium]
MPIRCLALVLVALPAALPQGLVNGSFEADTDGDGAADGWQFSGDAGVQAALRREQLADGTWCQVLHCTAYERRGGASHAMLAQVDTINLKRGQWYRFALKLRGRVVDGAVDVALRNTADWSDLGLNDSYFETDTWTTHETVFQATADSPPKHRLQLWWTSVGEVWFDDVVLEEDGPAGCRPQRSG